MGNFSRSHIPQTPEREQAYPAGVSRVGLGVDDAGEASLVIWLDCKCKPDCNEKTAIHVSLDDARFLVEGVQRCLGHHDAMTNNSN